jgi:hypothetical protein
LQSGWSRADTEKTFCLLASRADVRLAAHAAALVQKLPGAGLTGVGTAREQAAAATATVSAACAAADAAAEAARAPLLAATADALATFLSGVWDGGDVESAHWYAAAQASVDALFHVSSTPIALAERALHAAAEAAFCGGEALRCAVDDAPAHSCGAPSILRLPRPPLPPSFSGPRVARAFFLAGHVAVKLLAHAEALAARVRLLRIRASERAEAAASAPPPPLAAAAAPAAKKKGGKGGGAAGADASAPHPPAAAPAGEPKDDIEDQLGAAAAAEDEREADVVARLSESELARANLISVFVCVFRTRPHACASSFAR